MTSIFKKLFNIRVILIFLFQNEHSVSLIEESDDNISLDEIHSDDIDQPYNGKPIT